MLTTTLLSLAMATTTSALPPVQETQKLEAISIRYNPSREKLETTSVRFNPAQEKLETISIRV